MSEKKALAAWIEARRIYGKESPECITAKETWKKAMRKNAEMRIRRQMVSDICGTNYAAAMRDMGL